MTRADFSEHLVAFVDLLGFAKAVQDPRKMRDYLDLLTRLSDIGTEFEGSKGIKPTITAFSDNIVISYAIDDLKASNVELSTALLMLHSVIAYIAWNAMEAGLLIRGGVALGSLHHDGRIVFGAALVEAYQLKSQVAVYPRVVLSKRTVERSGADKIAGGGLSTDADGLDCLDYITFLILRGRVDNRVDPRKPGWVTHIRQTIQDALSDDRLSLGQVAKWRWFHIRFEREVSVLKRPHPEGLGLPD